MRSVEQNPARQVVALGQVDETFTDMVSGKSRAERPALARLVRHVRRSDTVRVASMDRLDRSVVDLAQLVHDLTRRPPEQVTEAHELVDRGVPKAKIARDLGCSRRALYDALTAQGRLPTTTGRRAGYDGRWWCVVHTSPD